MLFTYIIIAIVIFLFFRYLGANALSSEVDGLCRFYDKRSIVKCRIDSKPTPETKLFVFTIENSNTFNSEVDFLDAFSNLGMKFENGIFNKDGVYITSDVVFFTYQHFLYRLANQNFTCDMIMLECIGGDRGNILSPITITRTDFASTETVKNTILPYVLPIQEESEKVVMGNIPFLVNGFTKFTFYIRPVTSFRVYLFAEGSYYKSSREWFKLPSIWKIIFSFKSETIENYFSKEDIEKIKN